ncbi:MAG: universal stress protein [Bacillota bacterium]|nr:universal stress protein [Bacillota bacterium]
MKKILIPIEKNSEEKTTISQAVEIAKKFESKITLLNVDNSKELLRDINNGGFIDEDKLYEKFKDTTFLDEVKHMYKDKGIDTDTKLAEGDPASAILDEAEKGEYDLVIMRTHTMKERKRFMMGSVTNKVVHHINVPILIIR